MLFARSDDAVEDGGPTSALVRSESPPSVASHRDAAQSPFGNIVVDGEIAVVQINDQSLPLIACVYEGFAHGAFRQDDKGLFVDPCLELFQDGSGVPFAKLPPGLGVDIPRGLFDFVEFLNECERNLPAP